MPTSFHRSASFNSRRRGVFLYPPVIRNLPKGSPKPQRSFVLVLILIPFALAFLYTVDIRTHVISTLRRDPAARSPRGAAAASSPTNSTSTHTSSLPQHVKASSLSQSSSDSVEDSQPGTIPSSGKSVSADDIVADKKVDTNTRQGSTAPSTTMSTTTTTAVVAETSTTTTSTLASTAAASMTTSAATFSTAEALAKSVSWKNPNGIAPPQLPKEHPNHALLNSIRSKTQMTPRWPMTARSRADILKTYGQAFSSILVSHKLKVVYIPVFKVATTSMMWNIAYLENNEVIMRANRTEDEGELMKIIHDMSSPAWHPTHTVYELEPEDIAKILDDPAYLKFGFVRNPYDRIVSAYVDKVVRPEIFDEEYQDQMYSLYGSDPAIRKKVNETRPTFMEFLGAVKEIMSQPRVKSDDLNSKAAYENNWSRRDMHWRPQVELLHPDVIHLDYVGHFDRLNEDRQVVISWMHRNTNRRLPKQRSRKLHSTDPEQKRQLFDKLRKDDELRNLLLNIYEEDFTRFHFSTDVPTLEEDSANAA